MLRVHNRKAQSLTEFAMIMALVLGAIGVMQQPIRKAIWMKIQHGLNTYNVGPQGDGSTEVSESTQSTNITETVDYGAKSYDKSGNSNSSQNSVRNF